MPYFVLKILHQAETRRAKLETETISYSGVQQAVSALFPELQDYSAKYLDEEGDVCTLCEASFGDFISTSVAGTCSTDVLLKLELMDVRKAASASGFLRRLLMHTRPTSNNQRASMLYQLPIARTVPGYAEPSMASSRTSRVVDIDMGRRPIVGGNWKCNPDKKDQLSDLVANINACDTKDCDVYVCPSPLHVGLVYDKFTNGACVAPQNCNFSGCGAYTGEMAAEQMVDMGMKWCMIGHSERRGEFGLPTPAESNALMATKMAYLLEKGLNVIYAIGEPLPIREKGTDAVIEYCAEQLEPCKKLLDPERVVIAYEPVWSIGTGVTASPEQAQETHAELRKWLAANVSQECADNIRIQYGGSANAANAPDLSACPDVDGFLVGGASLKPEFKDIVAAIAKAKA